VQLVPPATVVRYGERLRIRGHVTNAAGAPAAHVKLRFTASSRLWVPPFLKEWSRRFQLPSDERTEGQLQSDGAGAFTVEIVAKPAHRMRMRPDPGLRDVPDVSRVTVDVEAREPGGRRVGRRCVVSIGEQALWWSVQSARGFFLSDEPPELRVEATRFDEQPLAASARWTVERLGEPDSRRYTPYGLPLQADLARYPAAAEVAHGALDTNGQDATALKLAALPAGLYRLRLDGSGGRGSFAFLVVDAQTGTLPGVLPPIAIARRDVYQPGETAELLIGGGGAKGRYQLETWQGGARVAQRIDAGPPLRLARVPLGDAVGERTARWIGGAGVATKSADVALSVRRRSPSLSIELAGQPQRLAPGQSLRLGVEVVDDNGQPVDGEALMCLIDDDLAPFAPRAGDWRRPPDAPAPPLPSHEGSVAGDQAIYLHDPKAAAWSSSSGRRAGPREVDIAFAAPRFAWEKPALPFGYGAIEPGRHVSPDAPKPPSSWVPSPPPAEPEPPLDPQLPSGRLGPLPAAELETVLWQPALPLPAGHGALELRLPARRGRWRLRILVSGRHGELGSRDVVLTTE
jgi:hypothetical protein